MRRKYFSETERKLAVNARNKERWLTDPVYKERTRNANIKCYHKKGWRYKRHGITLSHYEAMLKQQLYSCFICGSTNRKLKIDHCHINGKVRALLCTSCNVRAGWYENHREKVDLLMWMSLRTLPNTKGETK